MTLYKTYKTRFSVTHVIKNDLSWYFDAQLALEHALTDIFSKFEHNPPSKIVVHHGKTGEYGIFSFNYKPGIHIDISRQIVMLDDIYITYEI